LKQKEKTSNEPNQIEDYPDILAPQDLRKILRIGRAATYKLLAAGEIPSFKIGRTYRIPKAALAAYLEKCTKNKEELNNNDRQFTN